MGIKRNSKWVKHRKNPKLFHCRLSLGSGLVLFFLRMCKMMTFTIKQIESSNWLIVVPPLIVFVWNKMLQIAFLLVYPDEFLDSSVMLRWEKLLWETLSLLVTLAQLQCKSMLFLLSKRRETWWPVPKQVSRLDESKKLSRIPWLGLL